MLPAIVFVFAGAVESCKVIAVSYHQVIGPAICSRKELSDPDPQESSAHPRSANGQDAAQEETAYDFSPASLHPDLQVLAETNEAIEETEELVSLFLLL